MDQSNIRTETSEQTIINDLNRAQTFLQEIHTAQSTGADNLSIKVNQSSNSYDGSVSIPGGGGFYGIITLTFTANNQDYAFTDLNLRYYLDSVSPSTELPSNNAFVYIKENISTNPKVTSWEIKIPNNEIDGNTHTYLVKAFIGSTDTGVIS